MKKLKNFKEFKKKKTVIKKYTDAPYTWTSSFNKNSPAPGYSVNITTNEMPLNINI